jgi:hypothetical protein
MASSTEQMIARQLQRLANEVAADLTPATVAKRRRSPVQIKRVIDAARKRGDCVVIGPDKTVTITDNKPTGAAADTAEVNLFDIEAERLRRSKGVA